MKKLDELKFLLTSVFVINQTNGHKDGDISLILDYAFRRFYGANTNLFLLACAGKTKEQIMPEVQKLLEHTQYNNYIGGNQMKPYKAYAHIYSLDGEMDEITVLEETGNNEYLVDYRGVKCSAIFNTANFQYYADDVYGRKKE